MYVREPENGEFYADEPGNQEFEADKGDNEIEAENGYIEGYNEDNINPSLI